MSDKSRKAGGLPSLKSTVSVLLKSTRTRANIKNLLSVNQADGFDCPGCAWGDDKSGRFKFCENGAKAVAWESTDKKVGAEFFAQYSVTKLLKQSDYWLEYQGRLAEPMKYNSTSDHFEPIPWEQAFSLVANKLNSLSPDEIELYTSGRASNEVAYIYQLFGRTLGTNNFPDCSNMCHEASGVALTESIGVGKGTVVLEDFDHADVIFVYGQNPGSNHPRMMNALRKAARNGCKIISFNNLKEVALEKFASPQDPIELLTPAATDISHMYLTPKLGGDMAAIRGMVKHLIDIEQPFEQDFIARHTQGFDDYIQQVQRTSWLQIEQQSGLSKKEIIATANLFANAKNAISTWAMGITQHKHSVETVREIANLHLLFGQIGRKGAGLCPVRGHSNVQGNRTMGINDKAKLPFIQALENEFDVSLPKEPGHNVYHALKALHKKQSKMLICLGGNIAAAASDSEFTFEAVRRSEFNLHIATKLNRSHLLLSEDAIILPCLGRTEIDRQKTGEQAVTVEDTFSMVHASHGGTEPEGLNCMSETAIIANIAHATLGAKPVDWLWLAEDYSRIRDSIAKTIPGFSDFNKNIEHPGGFHLRNAARELEWNTINGKANFGTAPLPDGLFPVKVEQAIERQKRPVLTLQTLRSHDQYNTTIYGMNDRYRGIENQRRVLFINPADAKTLKLGDGDAVTITSIWDDNLTRSVHDFKLAFYDIPRGNVAGYYPETNPLVPIDSVGDGSFTPTSKSVAVIIEKSSANIEFSNV